MDRRLRAELARLLDEPRPQQAGRRVGIEQEFFVTRGGTTVDFRALARAGWLPGKRLDRGDPHAHRLSWGGVITADGREAEIATPPATLAPGFTHQLGGWLVRGRYELGHTLGTSYTVEGASTHLNVEVPDRKATSIAKRFVARHSLAMMLLLDRAHSPGLLVRPRRGRLELGGEFATGVQLVAASVFAAAAAMDCLQLGRRSTLGRFTVEPARERFGYYVDRRAFGGDLYDTGRSTAIGPHTAQWNLQHSWEIVRNHAVRFATDAELAATDAIVRGDHPLPCEHPDADEPNAGASTAWGADLTTRRQRRTFTLAAILATWDQVVFELTYDTRTCFLAVPADRASRLVEGFGSGELDELLRRIAAAPDSAFRPLLAADQIGRGGVFGSIGNGTTLQPLERLPGSGLIGGNGAGSREDKQRSEQERDPQPRQPRRPRQLQRPRLPQSWNVVVVSTTVTTVVAAGAVGTFLLTRGGDDDPTRTTVAAGTTVAPTRTQQDPTTAPTPTATSRPTTGPTTGPTSGPTGGPTAPPIAPADIAGTFTFDVTVVEGNTENPVGSKSQITATLSATCAGVDCTVTFPGLGTSPLVGGSLHYVGTASLACGTDASIKVPHPYDTKLTAERDATGRVTGFTGTQNLTAQPSNCPNTEVDPIQTAWVGTRS